MRVLLVEDDAILRSALNESLCGKGYKVELAADLAEARHWWLVQAFDAVLLDLNLPDGSGLSLLREMRRKSDATPVLVLTARNRIDERIAGLNAGADDYLGKPFDLDELDARLRALLRRSIGQKNNVIQLGALRLDQQARLFYWVQGDESMANADTDTAELLQLPAREFEVLWTLMTPPGRVVSKRMLAEQISAVDDWLADNALEAFVSRLRKKIDGRGLCIRTLRGLGYRLEEK